MSEIPENDAVGLPPKLTKIPTSVRIPEDIKKELPYIAVFNHKTNTAEQIREYIIEGATKVMNTARYEKFKKQMKKANR